MAVKSIKKIESEGLNEISKEQASKQKQRSGAISTFKAFSQQKK